MNIKHVLEQHKVWLSSTGGARANLGGADLRYANLGGANLRHADLSYANLRGADLYRANLGGADLRYANLGGANLRHANLRHANLRHADLSYANLGGADLRYANLGGANLRHANLRGVALNWHSHQLISEILFQHSNTTNQKAFAGLVRMALDWCWTEFDRAACRMKVRDWATKVLKPYIDDSAPGILKRRVRK